MRSTTPRNRPEDQQELLELCRQHDLIVTGGTDFHGSYASRKANPLGTCVTDAANLKKIVCARKRTCRRPLNLIQ